LHQLLSGHCRNGNEICRPVLKAAMSDVVDNIDSHVIDDINDNDDEQASAEGGWWHLDSDLLASVEDVRATLLTTIQKSVDRADNNDDRSDGDNDSVNVTDCGDDELGEGWRLLNEDEDYSACFDPLGWREAVMNKTHSKLSALYNLLRNQPGQGLFVVCVCVYVCICGVYFLWHFFFRVSFRFPQFSTQSFCQHLHI
jgi:hypothetical protein